MEELDLVRKQLGLEKMHLMGHSWGGSLAAAYVLSKGTKGIASLILSSALLSTPDWIRDAEELKKQLPLEVQKTLRKHELSLRQLAELVAGRLWLNLAQVIGLVKMAERSLDETIC